MIGEDCSGRFLRGPHENGFKWRFRVPVEDDAQRRDPRSDGPADRQLRIVSFHGPQTDGDRVDVGAQTLNLGARLLVTDPAALARGIVHFSIARQRQLQSHPRSIGISCGKEERSVELESCCLLDTEIHLNAVVSEMSRSTTGEGRRIGCGDHDTTYARVQNYFRTRWRLAKMVARLEGHVKRRSSRAVAGCPQSHYLGVGLAEARVKSLTDDNAVANDNSADHGVRRCLTPALLGEG